MHPVKFALIAAWLAAWIAAAPALADSFLPATALDPAALLPAPPANQSFQTTEELKQLHQIAADSSKTQVAAALADSKNETIFLFAPALGPDFTAARYPAIAALFKTIAATAEIFEKSSKALYRRPRPYQLDRSLIPACGASMKPSFSYPSGHTVQAWTQATVLAALLPAKADAIKARAASYAFEREICGVHYPTDLEAGHLLGVAIAQQILKSASFQTSAEGIEVELGRIK